ncbi:hypothetical protein MJH12_18030, partial [bacterium]|nr:hypothetical protein [bacterium]
MKVLLLLSVLSNSFSQIEIFHKIFHHLSFPNNKVVCIEKNKLLPYDKIHLKLGGFISGVTPSIPNDSCQEKKIKYGVKLQQKDQFLAVIQNQNIHIQTKSKKLSIHSKDII